MGVIYFYVFISNDIFYLRLQLILDLKIHVSAISLEKKFNQSLLIFLVQWREQCSVTSGNMLLAHKTL